REPSWRGEHPRWGTKNTLFRLDNMYVELLASSDSPVTGRWTTELGRFFDAHGEGVYALALGTTDIEETVRAMRRRNLDIADPIDGDGFEVSTGAWRQWRNAHASPKSTNGARMFFIEHRSPSEALPPAPIATP